MNKTDLIGKKFNKLTVIKFDRVEHRRDDKGKNRDKGYWLCKCECGKEVSIARNDLITGKIKSCGCLYKDNGLKTAKRNLKDLTGKKFNKLLVIGLDRTLLIHCCVIVAKESDRKWEEDPTMKKEEKEE